MSISSVGGDSDSPSGALDGKIAIVTGAGSGETRGDQPGVGEAISIAFAREGAKVWLIDVDPDRAERTRATIAGEGGDSVCLVGDATEDRFAAESMAKVVENDGRVDVLVNNVALAPPPVSIQDADEATWDRMLSVNLKSAFLMSKYAIPPMTAAGGGAIVNIASTGALRSSGDGPGYGPSKAGLISLTNDIAVGYGRAGIRANAIAPGHISTPMAAQAAPKAKELRRKVAPLGTEGTAWDVAWAAVFLASDRARFISGTCLPVDGAVTATTAIRGHRFIAE